MLHDLQDCAQRGVPIIIFNPLRERGFERFTNPQNPVEMLTGAIDADQLAVPPDKGRRRQGGADRLVQGLIVADDAAAERRQRVLDAPLSTSTRTASTNSPRRCDAAEWGEIEKCSGLVAGARSSAPREVYASADTAMIALRHGADPTVDGVENVQMIVNLLLLRGNIGKPGAGVCRCAATRTCRDSGPSASPKSPSWCRSTS